MQNAGAYFWGDDVVHCSEAPLQHHSGKHASASMCMCSQSLLPQHLMPAQPLMTELEKQSCSQLVAITSSCFGGRLTCTAPFSQFLCHFGEDIKSATESNTEIKDLLLVWVQWKREDGPNSTPSQYFLIFHGFGWNRFSVVLDTWSDSTSTRVYLSKTDLAVGVGVGICNKIKHSGCNWWDYSLESSHCESDFLSLWVG